MTRLSRPSLSFPSSATRGAWSSSHTVSGAGLANRSSASYPPMSAHLAAAPHTSSSSSPRPASRLRLVKSDCVMTGAEIPGHGHTGGCGTLQCEVSTVHRQLQAGAAAAVAPRVPRPEAGQLEAVHVGPRRHLLGLPRRAAEAAEAGPPPARLRGPDTAAPEAEVLGLVRLEGLHTTGNTGIGEAAAVSTVPSGAVFEQSQIPIKPPIKAAFLELRRVLLSHGPRSARQ